MIAKVAFLLIVGCASVLCQQESFAQPQQQPHHQGHHQGQHQEQHQGHHHGHHQGEHQLPTHHKRHQLTDYDVDVIQGELKVIAHALNAVSEQLTHGAPQIRCNWVCPAHNASHQHVTPKPEWGHRFEAQQQAQKQHHAHNASRHHLHGQHCNPLLAHHEHHHQHQHQHRASHLDQELEQQLPHQGQEQHDLLPEHHQLPQHHVPQLQRQQNGQVPQQHAHHQGQHHASQHHNCHCQCHRVDNHHGHHNQHHGHHNQHHHNQHHHQQQQHQGHPQQAQQQESSFRN